MTPNDFMFKLWLEWLFCVFNAVVNSDILNIRLKYFYVMKTFAGNEISENRIKWFPIHAKVKFQMIYNIKFIHHDEKIKTIIYWRSFLSQIFFLNPSYFPTVFFYIYYITRKCSAETSQVYFSDIWKTNPRHFNMFVSSNKTRTKLPGNEAHKEGNIQEKRHHWKVNNDPELLSGIPA